MLSVDVHAANIHDTKSGIFTAKEAYTNYPSIQKFCADAGYGIAKIYRKGKNI